MLQLNEVRRILRNVLVLSFIASAIRVTPYWEIGIPYVIDQFGRSVIVSRKFDRFPHVDFTRLTAITFGINQLYMLMLALQLKSTILRGPLLPIATFGVSAPLVLILREAFARGGFLCS